MTTPPFDVQILLGCGSWLGIADYTLGPIRPTAAP